VAIFKSEKVVYEDRILAVRNAEVRGSIPLCSTISCLFSTIYKLTSNASNSRITNMWPTVSAEVEIPFEIFTRRFDKTHS
jgi:hypothetical protein